MIFGTRTFLLGDQGPSTSLRSAQDDGAFFTHFIQKRSQISLPNGV
jgi:hypothetical protein